MKFYVLNTSYVLMVFVSNVAFSYKRFFCHILPLLASTSVMEVCKEYFMKQGMLVYFIDSSYVLFVFISNAVFSFFLAFTLKWRNIKKILKIENVCFHNHSEMSSFHIEAFLSGIEVCKNQKIICCHIQAYTLKMWSLTENSSCDSGKLFMCIPTDRINQSRQVSF